MVDIPVILIICSGALSTCCRYEDLGAAASGGRRRSRLAVDAHLFGEHDVLDARTDLLDVQVWPTCHARSAMWSGSWMELVTGQPSAIGRADSHTTTQFLGSLLLYIICYITAGVYRSARGADAVLGQLRLPGVKLGQGIACCGVIFLSFL